MSRPKASEPLPEGGAQRLGAPVSRIDATFAALKAAGRKALIPFLTAGDPYPDLMVELMVALADAGADIIELGVPFSDPMADGPVIQKASDRALARGVGLGDVLQYVRGFRQRNDRTPVVLMGYANPIERYEQHHGANRFAADAHAAGVDGVLVVDYPLEECEGFAAVLSEHGIAPIFLLAPTSTDARMQAVGRLARGYVYYVALKGVTGAGNLDSAAVAAMVPRIRAHVPVPVGVGFGIRDAAAARAVGAVADAVIIGSRLVQWLESQTRDNLCPAGAAFIAEMRAALDSLPIRSPA